MSSPHRIAGGGLKEAPQSKGLTNDHCDNFNHVTSYQQSHHRTEGTAGMHQGEPPANRAAGYRTNTPPTDHQVHQPQPGRDAEPSHTAEVYVAGSGPGDQYKVRSGLTNPPFDRIRAMCKSDDIDPEVDMHPRAFAAHRIRTWPHTSVGGGGNSTHQQFVKIYEAVRKTGLPNCMSAKIPLPSGLRLENWDKYIDIDSDQVQLMQYLRYGFPLGYMGPPTDTAQATNHSSATDHPADIASFIEKELGHGALMGPFLAQPFKPWLHVSPIMSRPKSDGIKRRVITDLTFPEEKSVNAFIYKNSILGQVRDHSLPTVAEFVEDLKDVGEGAFMFTVDIERAYKNFRVDPLDWPLMCLKWKDGFYVETAMPFGARSSSSNMQRVADFVVGILTREGMRAKMYLDDLIVVARTYEEASAQYKRVSSLLAELGLPEAGDKTQLPARQVRWLGIDISSTNMTLSIPQEKLKEVLSTVNTCYQKRTIHRRQYESLLGKLMYIAKCVPPARAFMARLLQGIRDTKGWFVRVTGEVRADLRWFMEFGASWNGVAIIPPNDIAFSIQVDASLTGIGATDGRRGYSGRVADDDDPAVNINEVEAINVIIALHSFLSHSNRGQHILVECDNLAAVQAIKWGRGRNRVLAECARMAWMLQAVLDVKLSFAHIAGVKNDVADALSRAHMSNAHGRRAQAAVAAHGLTIIEPCVFVLDIVNFSVKSRSGAQLAHRQSSGAAGPDKGPGYHGESPGGSEGARGLRPEIPTAARSHDDGRDLPVDRVHGSAWGAARNHTKQNIPCQSPRATGRRVTHGNQQLQSPAGSRRDFKTERHAASGQRGDTYRHTQGSSGPDQAGTGLAPDISGNFNHVLRHNAPVGGRASISEGVRSRQTPNMWGCEGERRPHNKDEMGKELTTVQRGPDGGPGTHRERWYLSGGGRPTGPQCTPFPDSASPIPGVLSDGATHYHGVPASTMELSARADRYPPIDIWPPQHKEGLSDGSGPPWMLRTGGPTTWWLEVQRA